MKIAKYQGGQTVCIDVHGQIAQADYDKVTGEWRYNIITPVGTIYLVPERILVEADTPERRGDEV